MDLFARKSIKGFIKKKENPKNQKSNFVENQKSPLDWVIVGGSCIGKSHISSNIPCQDNHHFEKLENNWGIAIVCDGAGSAKNSEKGSAHVAKKLLPYCFKELIKNESWIEKNKLPSQKEWESKASEQFQKAHVALTVFANENNIEFSSLACTAIVVIYSPIGLLSAHVGDGRAGFRDESGNWHALITPHKGLESNQTIFITSNFWQKGPDFKMSGVSVPECRVIDQIPTAFTLLSDGCEQHSFECSVINPIDNKWTDPNRPFKKFFDPLKDSLLEMLPNQSIEQINQSWKSFLENGNEGLKNEADDKTMILGILNISLK